MKKSNTSRNYLNFNITRAGVMELSIPMLCGAPLFPSMEVSQTLYPFWRGYDDRRGVFRFDSPIKQTFNLRLNGLELETVAPNVDFTPYYKRGDRLHIMITNDVINISVKYGQNEVSLEWGRDAAQSSSIFSFRCRVYDVALSCYSGYWTAPFKRNLSGRSTLARVGDLCNRYEQGERLAASLVSLIDKLPTARSHS